MASRRCAKPPPAGAAQLAPCGLPTLPMMRAMPTPPNEPADVLVLQHTGSPAAMDWLGAEPQAVVYQWHYDSFTTLPVGTEWQARLAACAH